MLSCWRSSRDAIGRIIMRWSMPFVWTRWSEMAESSCGLEHLSGLSAKLPSHCFSCLKCPLGIFRLPRDQSNVFILLEDFWKEARLPAPLKKNSAKLALLMKKHGPQTLTWKHFEGRTHHLVSSSMSCFGMFREGAATRCLAVRRCSYNQDREHGGAARGLGGLATCTAEPAQKCINQSPRSP